MPQLHCYIPESTMELLSQKAKNSHLSISKYLALLIQKDINTEWPDDFFDLYGSWEGDALHRDEQSNYETRETFL